ncbi:MAG: NAD(P)-binding domain-containing protein, partial [Candidatus Sericytochromatia bacterium]
MSKQIGILGSGDVATILAAGFKQHGYDVRVGSRSPEKLAAWAAEAGVGTGTFAEVAAFGDIVVLAVL